MVCLVSTTTAIWDPAILIDSNDTVTNQGIELELSRQLISVILLCPTRRAFQFLCSE